MDNEKRLEVISRLFKDNEELLKSLRALFFGLETTPAEKALIKSNFAEGEGNKLMWDTFCPELKKDSPIGQVQDVWMGAEQMVFDKSAIAIKQAIGYKDRSIKLVRQALDLLKNPDGEAIDLTYDPANDDEIGTDLLTRNQYIRHIETQLNSLHVVANQNREDMHKTTTASTK